MWYFFFIILDHAWSAQSKSRGQPRVTLACADCLWSTRSNSVLLAANLGDGSFFFFVQGSRKSLGIKPSPVARVLYCLSFFSADKRSGSGIYCIHILKKSLVEKKNVRKQIPILLEYLLKEQLQQSPSLFIHRQASLRLQKNSPEKKPWEQRFRWQSKIIAVTMVTPSFSAEKVVDECQITKKASPPVR